MTLLYVWLVLLLIGLNEDVIMEYLSPSRVNLFYANRKEFYMRYMSPKRPPDSRQTLPMAAGSSFDSYVKSYLHENLFGKDNDARFGLQAIFEAQVEPHARDWAWPVGSYLFNVYKKSGALADLMLELGSAINKPRFEIEVKGVVEGEREPVVASKTIQSQDGDQDNKSQDRKKRVIFLGKPDAFYINPEGCHIILDWKVNGFCGAYRTSPLKGYLKLRSVSGAIGTSHKDCFPKKHRGTIINCTMCLEDVKPDWANQLTIYSWLLGAEIGDDFVAAIDQMACNGAEPDLLTKYPTIKVAEHRLLIRQDYQKELWFKCQHIWDVVHSDWFFRDMTKEESQAHCVLLDEMAKDMWPKNQDDVWFNQVT